MLKIGLTGGIGSGKSAVAELFASLGAELVDTDAFAHRLSRPGEAGYRAIVERFGTSYLDATGALDRDRLRRRVFVDDAARAALEAILHPLIAVETSHAISRWRGPYGIVVVPLLLERSGIRTWIDRVLVVDCPEDEQVRRVMQRNGLAETDVRAIMATQLGRDARLAAADDVIDNAGPLASLRPQVEALDQRYRAVARAAQPATAPTSS